MAINPAIELCLHHIKDLKGYLEQLENLTILNRKLFGVMFHHSPDPMPPYPAQICIEDEIEIYNLFKEQYFLYRSKKAVFSRVPDAVASAARLSYYYCTHEIDPEMALSWLLHASEKKGIIEYQLTRTKREEHGSAYRIRFSESTSISKQLVLFTLHRFTPQRPSMSRAKIIDENIPEFERTAITSNRTLSCKMDSIYENICTWIHRDNEFKEYFTELENVIKSGKCPADNGTPRRLLNIYEKELDE